MFRRRSRHHQLRIWNPHHNRANSVVVFVNEHVVEVSRVTVTTVAMNIGTGETDEDNISVGWSVVGSISFVQPSAKAAPLEYPSNIDCPRVPAPFQVSSLPMSIASHPVGRAGPVVRAQIPRLSDLQQSPVFEDSIRVPVQSAPVHSSQPLPVPVRSVPPPLSLQQVDIPGESMSGQSTVQTCDRDTIQGPLRCGRPLGPPKQPANQVIRARYPSASPILRSMWLALLAQLGPLSRLWTETSGSTHQAVHLNRILDGYAPSTVLTYVSTCTSFLKTCSSMQVDISTLSDIGLADVLHTMSLSRSSNGAGGSSVATIKALRWLYKVADVQSLNAVNSSLVSSFLTRKVPKDRKQAPPLPLWILVQWGRRILMSSCPTLEVVLLGAFLTMAWASLRFSDVQRLDMHKVIYHGNTLRGLVWRSKASFGGIPFAVAGEGFLSLGSHNWVWKFLTTLDKIYTDHSVDTMDFLIPHCTVSDFVHPLTAMDYPTALYFLRYYLACPWRSGVNPMHGLDLNFTLHSLKATLLAWGPQLPDEVSSEQRLQQGHHADPNSSLATYSRDAVWSALSYQRKLIAKIQGGWRPQIAQHRGSQIPLCEPPVKLERFRKDTSEFSFQWFSFADTSVLEAIQSPPVDEEDSSSSSSTSSSSEEAIDPTPVEVPQVSRAMFPMRSLLASTDQFFMLWSILMTSKFGVRNGLVCV